MLFDNSMVTLSEQMRLERIREYEGYLDIPCLCRNPNVSSSMLHSLKAIYGADVVTGEAMSGNPNVTLKFILSQPFLDWDFAFISFECVKHCNIGIEEILRHRHLPWRWQWISFHPQLRLHHIIEFPTINWDMGSVLSVVPFEDILEHRDWLESVYDARICWAFISGNKNVPYSFVISNPQLPWDKSRLGYHQPIKDILQHPSTIEADMKIMMNSTVTMDDVRANPHIRWHSHVISKVVDNMQYVIEHPEISWSWLGLSGNPHIRFHDVLQHLNKPWCWRTLSAKMKLTLEDMASYSLLQWSNVALSTNPSILDIPEAEVVARAKSIIASNRIKRAFGRSISDPNYDMCCKRLRREFSGGVTSGVASPRDALIIGGVTPPRDVEWSI
jgi:hypothetical protein